MLLCIRECTPDVHFSIFSDHLVETFMLIFTSIFGFIQVQWQRICSIGKQQSWGLQIALMQEVYFWSQSISLLIILSSLQRYAYALQHPCPDLCLFLYILYCYKLESISLHEFNQIQRNRLNASQICAYRFLIIIFVFSWNQQELSWMTTHLLSCVHIELNDIKVQITAYFAISGFYL